MNKTTTISEKILKGLKGLKRWAIKNLNIVGSLVLLMMFAHQAYANNYYVDPSSTGDSCTENEPCPDLSKAFELLNDENLEDGAHLIIISGTDPQNPIRILSPLSLEVGGTDDLNRVIIQGASAEFPAYVAANTEVIGVWSECPYGAGGICEGNSGIWRVDMQYGSERLNACSDDEWTAFGVHGLRQIVEDQGNFASLAEGKWDWESNYLYYHPLPGEN